MGRVSEACTLICMCCNHLAEYGAKLNAISFRTCRNTNSMPYLHVVEHHVYSFERIPL